MKEKIKDTIVDLLLDGVKEKLDSVKENYKWQKLFVSTGDFFVNNPDVLVKFEDDLYSVFSKDNLIRIAKRLKDKNGYDFSQLLHNELYDLMVSYEIPIMETETYIHHFMQVIITYLEENDSDKALEMFLGDMRKEIGTYFAALESKLELVLNQISNLNKEKITTYSIADIDAQIRRETKYKGMGLDFFKLDDEQFESKFQNSLNDTKIYVVGKSREETTYRILNELKNKNSKRITLVVKSEKEWNKLQHSNLSGNILVPFFYADRIVVIPNNTNIFIYGEDEPCYTQNKLILRKRTKRNIIDSLEELGIDANEAYKMVDNTHGLYVPLKKKLFDGAMYDKPDWVEGHSDVVIAALLCGQWTEATGDVLVFEELSGNVQTDLDLDFRPSDVYLFAKVLWMTLKGDNIGFRGQYQRGDVQIFLNKENFGDVITLEPIHKLIEQATFEDMNKRISIHQCIDYLELQCNLLDERERELLSNELISRLLYDEHSKMIIERTKPDELIYEDKGTIFSMLRGVIPISKIMVKSLNDEQKAKQIQLTDFQVGSGGICKMLYFNNGIKVKEYIMEINKMTYSHLNLDIVLELNDIDSVDKEYVAYSETVRGFGNMYPKIYFSSDEKIIITKVK